MIFHYDVFYNLRYVILSLSKFFQMNFYLRFLFCFLIFGVITGNTYSQDTTQMIVSGRVNSVEQQKKPYLIFISIDGLRYDLVDKFDAHFLKQKREEGVQASSMKPSFPTLTFPNHYSLATGLYPAHHGIVGNSFRAGKDAELSYTLRDKKAVQNPGFYGGVPLWVLAEKQQMLSANFYWVGSEAPIDSTYATYYFNYNEAISIDRRIAIVKEWLQLPEDKRPHLIMFYMPEVDHQLHRYGTNSDSVRAAVQFIDLAVRKMNEMTESLELPVNYILVSDHGMIDVDTAHSIRIPNSLDTSEFKMGYSSSIIHLYAKDKKNVKSVYKSLKKEAVNYSVYLKKNTPKKWHYSAKDDCYNRLGDIILVADPGKGFNFFGRLPSPGEHGFDNDAPEMQATFYAWGPAFKNNYKIPSFENVNVYPLIAHLMGLNLICKIDGNLDKLIEILK